MQLLIHTRTREPNAGFSLVELMVVFTIITIALSMFSQTLTSASRLDPVSRETALASEAARNVIETMRGKPFRDVFALYNADGADDPAGAGTAPGATFDVVGLSPLTAEGSVGTIQFCDSQGALLETAELPEFGLPRDLNGDGMVDEEDHVADCIILPFKVTIEWLGKNGPRKLELFTVFADL